MTHRLRCCRCDALMHRNPKSLPQGIATCQPCRREAQGRGRDVRLKDTRPPPGGPYVRTCPACKGRFTTRRANQRFCQFACKTTYFNHGRREVVLRVGFVRSFGDYGPLVGPRYLNPILCHSENGTLYVKCPDCGHSAGRHDGFEGATCTEDERICTQCRLKVTLTEFPTAA